MKNIRLLFLLFLIIVFLAGIYWIFNSNMQENYDEKKDENKDNSSCPDMLIQKGDVLLLYNSKKKVDENNPIPFSNLDEYIYYLDAQRKLGNQCPVLYLTQESNAQGKDVYRIRPSPFDLQGGLPSISNTHKNYAPPPPTITDINSSTLSSQVSLNTNAINVIDASRENGEYNSGNYASFDPTSQYVGVFTNIDEIHNSTQNDKFSDNPMDANWGGVEYTQKMIDTGKYEDNNINKPMLFQPKTAFMPIDPNRPVPKDII
jgi:cbb3-type cytochrome oxidase subunit 3